ncbi:MAG: hypothetical protein IKG85_06060 [Clostridia bacterium]|nr:hypothetical protein [Clostridia bacterium]
MRKALIILFCILITVNIGCSNDANTDEHPNVSEHSDEGYCFDFHYGTLCSFMTGNNILETEDSIYYLYDDHLYFSDKSYKDFMPLCSRPNCSHDSEDCDAFIYTKSGIWIYGKHIYYVDDVFDENGSIAFTEPALWRMRLDGTQHEKLMQLPLPDYGFTPVRNRWDYVFTDKYLYVSNTAFTDDPGNSGTNPYRSYLIDLDSFAVRDVYSSDNKDVPTYAGLPIAGDGSGIYSVGDSADRPGCMDLMFLDYNNLEGRRVGTLEENFYYLEGGFMIVDDSFEYLCWDPSQMRLAVWRMDLETGANTLIKEGDGMEFKGYSMDWANGFVFDNYKRGDRFEWGFYVMDADLNEVETSLYEDVPDEVLSIRVFLQTNSFIFAAPPISFNPEHPDELGISAAFAIPTWYIDKSEIGTGNLAWRRWAPDGD